MSKTWEQKQRENRQLLQSAIETVKHWPTQKLILAIEHLKNDGLVDFISELISESETR